MTKPKGRQINLNQDPPTSVEQMKDGEMRIGEDGILARVGPQVLQRTWMKTILYDDFEDGIVDPVWEIWTDKAGGSHVESGGFMAITTNFGGSGGRYALEQNGILGIDDPIATKGTFYFDVWGKMVLPFTPDNNSYYSQVDFNFFLLGVPKDYIRLKLISVTGNTQYQPSFYWHDGTNARNLNGTAVDFGAGVNEIWWRLKFLPGDSEMTIWYHHGPENPLDSPYDTGWTLFVFDKYPPQPTGNDEMQVRLLNWNTSTDTDEITYFNELAEWEELTTTTTTTAPGVWVERFVDDSTGWEETVDVQWDGDSWNSDGISPEIRPNSGGTWEVGYRPTRVRLTIKTPSGEEEPLTTTIRDSSANILASIDAPKDNSVHVVIEDMTFFGEDIFRMLLANPTGYEIRSIEFWELV
jgi:hypothetical protein